MKNYIRDEDEVRLCISNIAQMNILEGIYYHRFRLLNNIIDVLKQCWECRYCIINIFIIILLPIVYPLMIFLEIQKAKKEMKLINKKE